MGATSISYVVNPDGTQGRSWNPLVGCPLPLCSDGCLNCWSRELHNRRHRAYLAGKRLPAMYAEPFEALQWFPERLEEVRTWRNPQVVAVCFQADIALATRAQMLAILAVMRASERNTFLLLTKRPELLLEVLNQCWDVRSYCWPLNNVYLGVTVCTQAEADKLYRINGANLWLSMEPMLEKIVKPDEWWHRYKFVVLGAESGKGARPMMVNWALNIRDQCKIAGVPLFVKQISLLERDRWRVSKDMAEWPEPLRVREFP